MLTSTNAILLLREYLKGCQFNIEVDPFKEFECLSFDPPQPLVLIEADDAAYPKISRSTVLSKEYVVHMTCMVNTANKEFLVYRNEADGVSNAILLALENLNNPKISLVPVRETRGEFMAGSVKVTSVILEFKIQ